MEEVVHALGSETVDNEVDEGPEGRLEKCENIPLSERLAGKTLERGSDPALIRSERARKQDGPLVDGIQRMATSLRVINQLVESRDGAHIFRVRVFLRLQALEQGPCQRDDGVSRKRRIGLLGRRAGGLGLLLLLLLLLSTGLRLR